jgi:hypothetical protein
MKEWNEWKLFFVLQYTVEITFIYEFIQEHIIEMMYLIFSVERVLRPA